MYHIHRVHDDIPSYFLMFEHFENDIIYLRDGEHACELYSYICLLTSIVAQKIHCRNTFHHFFRHPSSLRWMLFFYTFSDSFLSHCERVLRSDDKLSICIEKERCVRPFCLFHVFLIEDSIRCVRIDFFIV